MTDQNYRDIIAHNWLDKADEACKTAEVLLREKLLVGCVNRLYYAVFYAVSAALAKDGREYGKHTAVRAALHRDYVKTGKVAHECSAIYDELFDDRQEGDYTPRTSFKEEDISRLLEQARMLVDCFRKLVG